MQGLYEVNPKAVELEESNALALAILPPGMHDHHYFSSLFRIYTMNLFLVHENKFLAMSITCIYDIFLNLAIRSEFFTQHILNFKL